MKGGILSAAIATPFASPHAAPAANAAAMPATTGAPFVRANAHATPASAIIEPTERSIPPETITTVMPIAMIVMTAVCRDRAALSVVRGDVGDTDDALARGEQMLDDPRA